jgi:ABC-type oligopeptide transport system ATPase subunit
MAFLELLKIKTHFPVHTGGLIRKTTDTVRAVDGVNLSLEEGKILGLVGGGGYGKSTLSRTIMQLISATSGAVIPQIQQST